MRHFTEEYSLGKVRSAAFQMKLATSGREPDILFVSQENLGRIKRTASSVLLTSPLKLSAPKAARETEK